MNKRQCFLIVGLIFPLLFLIACSKEMTVEEVSHAPETGDQKRELKVAIAAQPPTIDPLISTATISRDVALQIFEPLITINKNLQPQPMLAESYELSDDGKTLTFHLRESVKFHNGEPMTSEDVVASMNRWLEHSSHAKSAFQDATFQAEDDHTVLLEMSEPNQTALSILSHSTQFPAIMPKEIVESAGPDGVDKFIGTGPFQFEEWKQDAYIKLSKYEDYSPIDAPTDGPAGKREAHFDELTFMIVTDSSTRIAGMKSGEYDIAANISFDDYDQVEADENIEPYMELAGYNVLVFNKKQGIFSDQKMRQAVAAALDLDEVMQAAFSKEEFYEMNSGIMLEIQTDWHSTLGEKNYNQKNPNKAKELLEGAGYSGEAVSLITSREYEDFYNSTVVIKEHLEEIGMPVEIEVYDWSTLTERREDPEAFDAFVGGFGISTDPTQLLFLDSKKEWPGWTDSEKIDQLLDEIRLAATEEEAYEKAAELQVEIWDYLPVLKLGDKNVFYAVNKELEGF